MTTKTKQTKVTPIRKPAKVTTTTTPRPAAKMKTAKTAKAAPTPGICAQCGFTLSGIRTRCRVPAACAKRLKAVA